MNMQLLNEPPRCADCTFYPLSFCDQERFCRTVMETVSFMRPACEKQSERMRAPSVDLEHLKLQALRRKLTILGKRLNDGLQHARCQADERWQTRVKIKMVEDFRDGASDDLLRKEWGGVVYFIQCSGFIKIGHTSGSIERRMKGLMCGNPYDLKLIGVVPGPLQLERKFQAHLKEHRHRLEWFRFDERCQRRVRSIIKRNDGHYFG